MVYRYSSVSTKCQAYDGNSLVVYVYGCSGCGIMRRAEKEPSLLKSSIATPSLVAGIMNAKYVNSVPLNRQEQEFKRYGLNLSTRTMSNWMIRCSEDYLYPIYESMITCMLQGKYTHCDETRIQVLGEPGQKAETKNWMWVYMTDKLSEHPLMVIYRYERTRGRLSSERISERLPGISHSRWL